jgi:hypothetical protein
MLDLSQMITNFEVALDEEVRNIQKFWLSLSDDKDKFDVYDKGIMISENMSKILKMYEEIE